MIVILFFGLSLAFILAIIYLIRYHLAVKSLSQQIEEKINNTSQRRFTLKNQPKSLIELTNKIENLFGKIEKTSLIALQEKKTLDMAISNIAHDIRTPLTIASGYTQKSLHKETVDAADLEKISENLTIVSKRLEALLEYRRLTEGTIRPQVQKIALSHLVTKSILSYYDMFRQVGITLDLQIEEKIPFETDPEIFERFFQNIISNILKHGKNQAQLILKKTDQKIVLQTKNIVRAAHPAFGSADNTFLYRKHVRYGKIFRPGTLYHTAFSGHFRRRIDFNNFYIIFDLNPHQQQ